MIYASAEALSTSLLPAELADHWIYPDIRRIRDVSVIVTAGVIRAAQRDSVDRELALRNISDDELLEYIRERMYDPFTEHEKVTHEIRELSGHLQQHEGAKAIASRPGTANGATNGSINGRL